HPVRRPAHAEHDDPRTPAGKQLLTPSKRQFTVVPVSTTRERILTAAVTCFGRAGFDVGLREIGAEAGFSAALVVRHFGSKDGLRQACDEHVAAIIRTTKHESVASGDMRHVLAQLAAVHEYAEVLAYTVRSLMTGGELAHRFVEQMVTDSIAYLAEAEQSVMIRPAADPEARARYITYSALGGLLMQLRNEYAEGDDLSTLFRDVLDRQLMPSVELYTHGLFTDTRVEDALRAAGYGTPPGDQSSPDNQTAADGPSAAAPTDPDIPPTPEGDRR